MYTNLRKLRKEKKIPVKHFMIAMGLKTEAAYFKKENKQVVFTLEEAKIISEMLEESLETIFFTN